MRHLIIFMAVAIADMLWTRYIVAASARHPIRAGIYSALIVVAGALTTTAIVHDYRYLVPAALGAFVGTYWTVRTA